MDRFKLEIFKKESEKDFTFYKTLSMEESSSFLNELSVQFHVQCENFNILQNIGEPREDMNAASDEFQVERLFTKTNHLDEIAVVWNFENRIDVFSYDDFCKYFSYIWYPVVDDILVTDMKYDFIFFIRHDGVIFDIYR